MAELDRAAHPAPAPAPGIDAPNLTRGFLFADLRDYTGFVETHGNRAGAALLARYRALVREVVAAAAGAETKTEGDSFYVVFGSVSAAVGCGLAIIEAAGATAADPDPIHVGVGVHAGETVETAEGFVGSAVNIAARLCAEAKSGEVIVSETVRGLTRTQIEVEFRPLGLRRLKGVPEPVACYRVAAPGAAAHPAQPIVGRRPSRLLAAGLAIALVAIVAVWAVVLFAGSRAAAPSPGPSAAAVPSASAAPTASALPSASRTLGPFPNEVEAAILAALPSTLRSTCLRGGTSDDARLAGFKGEVVGFSGQPTSRTGTVSLTPVRSSGVTCHPVSGAARLYVMTPVWPVHGAAPADLYVGFLGGHYGLPYGSCATEDRAYERWTGLQGSGLLACINPYDGRPWIYFTFGDGKYLAFATRDDSDYPALYQWWDEVKTFLP